MITVGAVYVAISTWWPPERVEQRVREGLEKMKKGLANRKRVKLTIENQHASESPKPEEPPIPSLFNCRLFSWLQREATESNRNSTPRIKKC